MKKNNFIFIYGIEIVFLVLFFAYSYLCVSYASSFEVGWNESYRLFQSQIPFWSHIFPSDLLSLPNDRGWTFPAMVWFLSEILGFDLLMLRQISVSFHLCSLIVLFLIARNIYNSKTALLAVIFYSLNYDLFVKSNALNPYSMINFMTLFLLIITLRFVGTKKQLYSHVAISSLSLITLFTSIIPIGLSLYFISKKYISLIVKHYYLYIFLICYFIYKALLILDYRVIKRSVYSLESSPVLDGAVVRLLEFYNIYVSKILSLNSPVKYIFVAGVFLLISSLPFYLIHIFRSKNMIDKLTFNYFLIMLFSYFILIVLGADEIVPRYYFPFLAFFYITYSNYILGLAKGYKGLITILIISLLLSFNGLSFYQKLKVEDYMPLQTALVAYKLASENDVICVTDNLGKNRHLRRLGLASIEYRSLIRGNLNKVNCDLLSYTKAENIYTISSVQSLDRKVLCQWSTSDNCIDQAFLDELGLRDRKVVLRVGKANRNQELYIIRYKTINNY